MVTTTMDIINHSITLTVGVDDLVASRLLSTEEIIIIMGYMNVAYTHETSLFCDACRVFESMDADDLLLFLDYEPEDWQNMFDYVEEYVYPLNVVDCRKN